MEEKENNSRKETKINVSLWQDFIGTEKLAFYNKIESVAK